MACEYCEYCHQYIDTDSDGEHFDDSGVCNIKIEREENDE